MNIKEYSFGKAVWRIGPLFVFFRYFTAFLLGCSAALLAGFFIFESQNQFSENYIYVCFLLGFVIFALFAFRIKRLHVNLEASRNRFFGKDLILDDSKIQIVPPLIRRPWGEKLALSGPITGLEYKIIDFKEVETINDLKPERGSDDNFHYLILNLKSNEKVVIDGSLVGKQFSELISDLSVRTGITVQSKTGPLWRELKKG